MTKFIDVTVPLSPEMPTFPGDPPLLVQPTHRLADGKPFNLSRLTLGSHAGTHVDAPYHFLPLEILMGKARVISMPGRPAVTRADLEALDLSEELRLLVRTRNSGTLRPGRFHEDFVYLEPEAARYVVQSGIKLLGWDYLSLERFGSTDYAAHHALLGAGVVVVEGLDLSQVEPGEYEMACLPLRLAGGDGSPARVVLRPR
jgi:arylformamidase